MGTQLPSSKRGQSPQILAHVYCGQMAAWIKMPLGMQVGLSPSDFVLDRDSAPPPQFSAHFCCGQTAQCIKMPLGTEVGLSPDPDDLMAIQPPPRKGAEPPISAQLLQKGG